MRIWLTDGMMVILTTLVVVQARRQSPSNGPHDRRVYCTKLTQDYLCFARYVVKSIHRKKERMIDLDGWWIDKQ